MLIVLFSLEITETDKPTQTKVKIEQHKLSEIISQNSKNAIKANKGD